MLFLRINFRSQNFPKILNYLAFPVKNKLNIHLVTIIFRLRWFEAAKKMIKKEIFILDDQNGRPRALSLVIWFDDGTYNLYEHIRCTAHNALRSLNNIKHNKKYYEKVLPSWCMRMVALPNDQFQLVCMYEMNKTSHIRIGKRNSVKPLIRLQFDCVVCELMTWKSMLFNLSRVSSQLNYLIFFFFCPQIHRFVNGSQ